MKKLNIFMMAALLTGIVFSSCQKSFNPKSYAPTKPLPSFGGYNNSKEIETAALKTYFNFNNSITTDSLGSMTGKSAGTASLGTGVSGKGYQGAVGSYVVFDNPGPGPSLQSYTISFWMKSPKVGTLARGIFSFNNPTDFWGSLDIYLNTPNNTDPNGDTLVFRVHMTNQSGVPYAGYFLQAKVPKAIDTWTHMVVTYDATTSIINFYQNATAIGINGVAGTTGYVVGPAMPGDDPNKKPEVFWGPLLFKTTAAVLGTWQFQTSPSLSNAGSQSWAESFTGGMDNFRIYNKALSSAEVSALFNLEKLGR